MSKRQRRIPKIGDLVAAKGETGAFLVYGIDSSLRCAEIKQIGHEFALSSIRWEVLTFLDELDGSQAAAPDRERSHKGKL
jgi:hypothetical protein